jgi:two-component system, LuxR family, response regulator FixJ
MVPMKAFVTQPISLPTSLRGATGGPVPLHDSRPSRMEMSDNWVAIIDDHQSMRSSIARIMRIERILALAFASAEDYLEQSTSTAPCCLVLDMQLPGMSGLELATFLQRERPPLPPTIFISAHDDLLASLRDGQLAHARLSKPFEVDELLALVKPLAERQHAGPQAVR